MAGLLLGGCLLAPLAPTVAHGQEPAHRPVRITTRLGPEEMAAFDRVLETLRADADLEGLDYVTRPHQATLNQGLPPRGEWDLVVGFPASVLSKAAENGELLSLADGQLFQVLRVFPYGVLPASERPTILSWGELLSGAGGALLAPDPLSEPEFGEAMASLLAVRGAASVASLLSRRRYTAERSTAVRGMVRVQPGLLAIAALEPRECLGSERLPAGRIGLAVAKGVAEPEHVRRLAARLAEPETRRRWLLRREGIPPEDLARVPVHAPPGARELETLVVLISAPRVDAASDETWESLLETVLLVGFGVLFLWIVLTAGRRRA